MSNGLYQDDAWFTLPLSLAKDTKYGHEIMKRYWNVKYDA